jgi:hypothetical protein
MRVVARDVLDGMLVTAVPAHQLNELRDTIAGPLVPLADDEVVGSSACAAGA